MYYFTCKIRNCLDMLSTPIALKTCSGLICNEIVQFQMDLRKIRRRRSGSIGYAELGHFTLLFAEDN